MLDRVAKSPLLAFCSSESEKCHSRFPYKSMTHPITHTVVIDLDAANGAH